jgi:hypothetical protein
VCVGTFAECSCEAEVQHWVRYNIFLLLEVGTFSALVELLNMEIEYVFCMSLINVHSCYKSYTSHPLFVLWMLATIYLIPKPQMKAIPLADSLHSLPKIKDHLKENLGNK